MIFDLFLLLHIEFNWLIFIFFNNFFSSFELTMDRQPSIEEEPALDDDDEEEEEDYETYDQAV